MQDRPPFEIELDPPLEFKGGAVARVAVREPSYHEVRMAEAAMASTPPTPSQERAYQIKLVSVVAQVPEEAVGKMPASRLLACVRHMEGFIVGRADGGGDGGGDGDGASGAGGGFAPDGGGLPPSFDLPLDPPVTVQGVSYETLPLKEPTARQFEEAERKIRNRVGLADIRDYQLALVSAVAGLPPQVVRQVPISRFREAVRYLEGFLQPGPGTGAT